jgi:hypothetical protein
MADFFHSRPVDYAKKHGAFDSESLFD